MQQIQFRPFTQIAAEDFLPLLNDPTIRKHLITHPLFDSTSIKAWIRQKVEIDNIQGCRVRAILIGNHISGWCALQPDENGIELAIVINKQSWGAGLQIFDTLMTWAQELNHEKVLFHLLDSRPEYKFLKKIACDITLTPLLGRQFTTYTLSVSDWHNNRKIRR